MKVFYTTKQVHFSVIKHMVRATSKNRLQGKGTTAELSGNNHNIKRSQRIISFLKPKTLLSQLSIQHYYTSYIKKS